MNFPVIKGAAYALIQANNLLLYQGTTQTTERRVNPQSEHLQKLPEHLRSFEDAVSYPPNQTYIGNILPDDLQQIPRPWFKNPAANASRQGRFGEIMPEDEFYGLMKVVDSFELVILEGTFQTTVKEKLLKHPVLKCIKEISKLDDEPGSPENIEELVAEQAAQPLYFEGKLVGCVKKAHQFDEALSSEVMLGNLANKASSVLTVKLLLDRTDLNPKDVGYIVECSEEACGDMNQRGGGNFAKAIGELCGFVNATGSDTRSFCAGPSHALVEAAALVQSGIYSDVIVVGGGCTAKLGMNSKDHVKKGLPAFEDMLGAFAVHISENDGKSPVIRTDAIGRHTIGSGASPQAVMTAIVTDPLDKIGYKITDIDRYAAEMQNPEITEPAGAGNVPQSNYKMISALGVKRKEIDRKELMQAVDSFGMPGYAPTQGHIPSGVPFIGHACDLIMEGKINRAMIIGKGSLFLGRLTNLFDGVSLIMEKNSGKVDTGFDQEGVRKVIAEAMRDIAKTLKE